MANPKIGAAVVCGYVLGRRKKAKLAISLGLLAGSRIRPGQLGKKLADSPLLGGVSEQLRGELVNAGKTAATTALSARANRLADTIHERTVSLREQGSVGEGEEEHKPPKDTEPADTEEEEEEGEGEGDEEEEPEGTEEADEEEEDEEAADEEAPSAARRASGTQGRSHDG